MHQRCLALNSTQMFSVVGYNVCEHIALESSPLGLGDHISYLFLLHVLHLLKLHPLLLDEDGEYQQCGGRPQYPRSPP